MMAPSTRMNPHQWLTPMTLLALMLVTMFSPSQASPTSPTAACLRSCHHCKQM